MAPVAQWTEHQATDLGVGGSNPLRRSIEKIYKEKYKMINKIYKIAEINDPFYSKLIQETCTELQINLHKGDEKNQSFIAGKDIFLGKYEDEELMIISFFHEVGHILVKWKYKKRTRLNTLMIELKAWDLGIQYALNKGLLFSDNALKWGYERAIGYAGHDKRERTGWKFNKQAFI